MESAGSPKSRLPARRHEGSSGILQLWLAVCSVLVAWGASSVCPRVALQSWAVLCVLLLGLLWRFHLERASLPLFWNSLLSILLTAELLLSLPRHQEIPPRTLLATACACLLFYFLGKTLATAISEPGLQEVASAALVLAIGVHASPLVLVPCAVLSVVLWLRCCGGYGGALRSALLIYAPAAVGVLMIVVMRRMTPGFCRSVGAALEAFSPVPTAWGHAVTADLRQIFPALVFGASAVVARIVERRAGYGDLVYLGMLLLLVAGLSVGKLPGFTTVLDIGVVLYAGAMCLLALAPPRRVWCLLFLTSAMCASLCIGFVSRV